MGQGSGSHSRVLPIIGHPVLRAEKTGGVTVGRPNAGQQSDAREAGLACGFGMDDRWFRLGDRGRYAFFSQLL